MGGGKAKGPAHTLIDIGRLVYIHIQKADLPNFHGYFLFIHKPASSLGLYTSENKVS